MITHDICQPWEVELARLKKQLEEAEGVISFYGNKDFYHDKQDYKGLHFYSTIGYQDQLGADDGKRAREYMDKHAKS